MGGPGCEQPSKERVRGSLLKRPSIRELAAFHLLRFAPDSLSLASFILHHRWEVDQGRPSSSGTSSSNLEPGIEIERRWNIFVSPRPSFEIDRFDLFEENLGGAEIKRASKKASSLTVRCFLLSRPRDCPSLVPSYSFRRRGGVERLNDRIPRPSNRVFAGSVRRLSTN